MIADKKNSTFRLSHLYYLDNIVTVSFFFIWTFLDFSFTDNVQGDVSSLREHHDTGLCSDPSIGAAGNSHRVEKRSYLPPVTCTSFHEQNAVRSKVHCQPRPRVIRLPWPNDTSVQQVSYTAYLLQILEIESNIWQQILKTFLNYLSYNKICMFVS